LVRETEELGKKSALYLNIPPRTSGGLPFDEKPLTNRLYYHNYLLKSNYYQPLL
jgi:hypothetical protein